MYKVKLDKFEGPLSLLLQLIEKEDLDINQISLAHIADEYIEYINHEADLELEELADFLLIASKLLYIKSKSLLPYLVWEEEEEEATDLEHQLKLYKAFQVASLNIEAMIKEKNFLYSRQRVVLEKGFYPPKNTTIFTLKTIYSVLINSIEPLVKTKEVLEKKVISIKVKIGDLKDRISKQAKLKFHEFVGKAKDRTEVVVSFLALLELIKQRLVDVEQSDLFKDITINKR